MVDELVRAKDREKLEGFHTDRRSIELKLDPVRGTFDGAHLREINRRLFQDLPGLGFLDVTPGQYRPAVPDGADWMKNRGLSTQPGSFFVVYSRMDAAAHERLNRALEGANPATLRGLKTADFAASMGSLYTALDYAHPFTDGNSRTLRTFTQQLATESGYDINWEKFALNDTGRDLLYIARDKSVNQLARPHLQHEHSLLKIIQTEARTVHSRELPDLLRDVIRPLRALAFERMAQSDALRAHPDLGVAYATLETAAKHFKSSVPENAQAQHAALTLVRTHVQTRLNGGETMDFKRPGPREPSSTVLEKSRDV